MNKRMPQASTLKASTLKSQFQFMMMLNQDIRNPKTEKSERGSRK